MLRWPIGGDPADLSAYVDGELPKLRRLRLRLHLGHCEACRRYVEQLQLLRAVTRAAASG